MDSNSKLVSVPPSCPSSCYIQQRTSNTSSVTTSSQPPLYTLHSVVTPLTCSRATPSVDQTWHSTWTTQEVGIASCSFLTSGFALRLHARSVFTRLKPPAAPRSMNVATESSTPPLSSLNPNTVAPKPIHKSSPKGPRASWPALRNLSGSSSTTTVAANMSTSPSALPTNSFPTSSMLTSPSLLTTMTQYIPRGPSATRDLERWPNMTKDFDLLMEMRERDRDRDRECGGDSVRD